MLRMLIDLMLGVSEIKGRAMQSKTTDRETEQAVRMFVNRIAGQFDIAGAILFGSRARQTHQPDSDADVAILLRGAHQRFLPTKLAMSDVAFDVLLDTGINISPLPVWLDEWDHPEAYSNPALLMNIEGNVGHCQLGR